MGVFVPRPVVTDQGRKIVHTINVRLDANHLKSRSLAVLAVKPFDVMS